MLLQYTLTDTKALTAISQLALNHVSAHHERCYSPPSRAADIHLTLGARSPKSLPEHALGRLLRRVMWLLLNKLLTRPEHLDHFLEEPRKHIKVTELQIDLARDPNP